MLPLNSCVTPESDKTKTVRVRLRLALQVPESLGWKDAEEPADMEVLRRNQA